MNLRVDIIVKLNGFFVCLVPNKFMSTVEDLYKYKPLNKQDLKILFHFGTLLLNIFIVIAVKEGF